MADPTNPQGASSPRQAATGVPAAAGPGTVAEAAPAGRVGAPDGPEPSPSRRRRGAWHLLGKPIPGPRAVIAALTGIAFVIAATCFYYNTVEEQFFSERDAHLTEIAAKMADQLSTVMAAGFESASVGGAYLAEVPIDGEQGLIERLSTLEGAAGDEGSLLLAIDEDNRYYTARGKTGDWAEHGAYHRDGDMSFAVATLPYDTVNTYLLIVRHLPAPVDAGDGIAVDRLAVATNMAAIQQLIDVSGFGEDALTYLVSSDGERIYQNTFGQKFIATPNVLDTLIDYDFLRGGNGQTLKEAIAEGRSACLEFRDGEGREWFVSATGIRGASLLLFVPTATLSTGEGTFLITTFGYFLVILVVVIALAVAIMSFIAQATADVRLIAQQEDANRRLEEANRKLEEARDKAELASRAKTEFLSNMSHDIRTPMNAIIGFTNLAETHLDDRPRVQDCLEKIASASNHLLSLINDILDMSKIEHGKIQMQPVPCDLRAVLRELAAIVRETAQAKGLAFSMDTAGLTHPWVVADPLRLNQILINIASNAVKYTERGRVGITVRELEGAYVFTVTDTGIGMSADYLPEIFDAFSRERNATLSAIQGTGLGLAITKNLVELMGGSIEVESEPGRGSTFTVTLPLPAAEEPDDAAGEGAGGIAWAEQAAVLAEGEGAGTVGAVGAGKPDDAEGGAPQPPAAPRDTAASLDGLRILLAEDNELNALIVIGILGDAGITIDWVENGREAVDALAQAEPGYYGAVLMDAQMPVMDGYDAARAIHALADGGLAATPIIALTANAFEEDRRRAFEAGMSAHVAKPINTKELLATIAHLCCR